jgi:pimeloyl-ACP methyl ester carboxylesterase
MPTRTSRSAARPAIAGVAGAVLLALSMVAAGCSSSAGRDAASTTTSSGASTTQVAGTGSSGSTGPTKAGAYTGSAFYTPPDPLPAGPHGTLIRYQAMPELSVGKGTAYRILYRSESIQGKPIAVSGIAVVPTADAPASGRKLLTIAHGTTGIADECAPSRSPKASEILLAGPVVDEGFLVAMSDYEGLGTPGRHPYLVGESEGRSVMDAIVAAGQLPDAHPGKKVAIAGYSQGGHGALWADQVSAKWTPHLQVVGTFAGAPASEVDVILAAAPRLPIAGFAYLLVAGIAAAYPEAKPSGYLTPAGVAKLDVVDQGCTGKVMSAFGGIDSKTLINPKGLTGTWARIAKANDAGGAKVDDPTLIIHSAQDNVVPIAFSQILLKRMCGVGDVVQRVVLPKAGGHVAAAIPAYQQALPWLEARFDTDPPNPVDSCTGS